MDHTRRPAHAAHEDEPAPLACARTLGYTHDNVEDDTLTSAKAAEILTL